MLQVVAAVIHDPAGRILIAQRPLHKHQGGLWEFPGGKIDAGESAELALARELWEELGIEITQWRHLLDVEYHYPDKSVCLQVFRVTAFVGQAHGAEGQPIRWVHPGELHDYAFPAANTPILKAACLPEHYVFMPEIEPQAVAAWLQTRRLQANQWLVLRAPALAVADYRQWLHGLEPWLQAYAGRWLLHEHSVLLPEFAQAAGVHLPARHLPALVAQGRSALTGLTEQHYLGISCHDTEELQQAWQAGADLATLSPVQHTETHPQVTALGWEQAVACVRLARLPVFLMGGLGVSDLPRAQAMGAQGLAGIRGLWVGQQGGEGLQ